MFCEKCGNKYQQGENFCTNCGASLENKLFNATTPTPAEPETKKEERWWHRLANVIYIIAHLPLLIIVPLVWTENARQYSTYTKTYRGSDGEALWYCFLTIVIWLLVLRLVKMTLKYIARETKPKFKDLLHF
jgi:hypothetical protein